MIDGFFDRGFAVGIADINTAFSDKAIGSKVVNRQKFMELVIDGIEFFDWSSCRQEGQAYFPLPKVACAYVVGGVGQRTNNPNDYVIRLHRG